MLLPHPSPFIMQVTVPMQCSEIFTHDLHAFQKLRKGVMPMEAFCKNPMSWSEEILYHSHDPQPNNKGRIISRNPVGFSYWTADHRSQENRYTDLKKILSLLLGPHVQHLSHSFLPHLPSPKCHILTSNLDSPSLSPGQAIPSIITNVYKPAKPMEWEIYATR